MYTDDHKESQQVIDLDFYFNLEYLENIFNLNDVFELSIIVFNHKLIKSTSMIKYIFIYAEKKSKLNNTFFRPD